MSRRARRHRKAPILVAELVAVGLLAFVATDHWRRERPYFDARSVLAVSDDDEVYFGLQVDWSIGDPIQVAHDVGIDGAVYGTYLRFPLDEYTEALLLDHAAKVRARGAAMMLTLEPHDGLGSVDAAASARLTSVLRRVNADDVPVLVRFGHEMNGSWYAWGLQPRAYVEAFREVADAVHRAPRSTMLWSPNDAYGYPFPGSGRDPVPGSDDFSLLDTNGDGTIDDADDPYGPYYPGDDVVDWVGLTVYHFGEAYPWDENVVPDPGKFVARLRGSRLASRADFYATYAEGRRKPMAISETSALFHVELADGASNRDIKAAWWEQLFAADLARDFPRIKLLMWFDIRKQESDSRYPWVDWALSTDPAIAAEFVAAMPDRFVTAQ